MGEIWLRLNIIVGVVSVARVLLVEVVMSVGRKEMGEFIEVMFRAVSSPYDKRVIARCVVRAGVGSTYAIKI